MKNTGLLHPRIRATAFTLIELLVVIAIIGILAGLVLPIAGAVNKRKQISLAQTQLKDIESAIDGYKTKLGFYPPDNTNNFAVSPLYFELLGTTNDGVGKQPTVWGTLDGSASIGTITVPDINATFGISGFANTSTRAHSDDSGAAASTFLNNLTPNQIGLLNPTDSKVKILVCAVNWPADKTPYPIPQNSVLNPWRYNSSHPTNNTSSYDLWVDIIIKGKTNRVSNWSAQPIQL
jgi:prepilin-type N-terminal cleavage/methylation domain-containing protein